MMLFTERPRYVKPKPGSYRRRGMRVQRKVSIPGMVMARLRAAFARCDSNEFRLAPGDELQIVEPPRVWRHF